MSRGIPAAILRDYVVDALQAHGVSSAQAQMAAMALVDADLLGMDTHGVAHLLSHPSYIPGLQSGLVNAQPAVRVQDLAPNLMMVDGDHGMGLVAMATALDAARVRCKATGMAVAWVRHSYHAGALATYTRNGALDGLLTMAVTSTRPSVAPTYGIRAALGTNAISVGVPYEAGRPLLLDMATSAVAAGKIEQARREQRPIPEGWIIDRDGRNSTDPAAYFDGGALLPLGSSPAMSSYKGYGLAVMVDVLAGVLSAMGHSLRLPTHGHAHMIACIDVERVRPFADFQHGIQQMVDDLHQIPAVPGQRVLVPGEREWQTYQERTHNGIPVSVPVLEGLWQFAADHGLTSQAARLSQYRTPRSGQTQGLSGA